VQSIQHYDGTVTNIDPVVAAQGNFSQLAIDTVREGMRECGTIGTASGFARSPYTIACKTGTAQDGLTRSDNGVFIAYAPIENPQIAIAVVMQNGTSGPSQVVAKQILDYYFMQMNQDTPPTMTTTTAQPTDTTAATQQFTQAATSQATTTTTTTAQPTAPQTTATQATAAQSTTSQTTMQATAAQTTTTTQPTEPTAQPAAPAPSPAPLRLGG